MQVSAATFGQKLTLQQKNVPIAKLFLEIRKQTGYDVLVESASFKSSKRINADFLNADVNAVMDEIVKGSELKYAIEGKTIVLTERTPSFLEKVSHFFAAIDVHGRVVDEKGQAIPGATVKVKNGKQGTITDGKGNFDLNGIDEGATLVISFLGYQNKEVSASKELGEIALELSTSKLDEVQIVAYGQTTKRFDIGNVASVSAKDIEYSPVTNLLQAIQGRVTGLNVTQANGYAGAGMTTQIQGLNSINAGSNPFIVVDGVPYSPTMIPGGPNILGGDNSGARGSTLSYFNPADIESISILKDADATAIYGSRAANGAILITTKKGGKGAMNLDFRFDQGWQTVGRYVEMLNTEQYLQMRHEGLKNSGGTVGDADFDLNGAWDTTRYTDWQKKLFGTSKYTNANVSISGGNDNVNYLAGLTYNRQTGVFDFQTPNTSFSFHSSIGAMSSNKKFKANMTTSYQNNNNRLPGSDMAGYAYTLAPDAPELFNPDGTINWQPAKGSPSTFSNPLASYLYTYNKFRVNNLVLGGDLSYDILPGLKAKLNGGYNLMNTNNITASPLSAIRPSSRQYYNNQATFSTGYQNSWSVEPQLSFQKIFGSSYFDALLGGSLQRESSNYYGYTGSNYSTELLLENPAGAGTYSDFGANASQYRYNAVFGRVNYRFKDRYLLNASIRRDGSSRFGPENKFHTFYSIGGGWIFSDETFNQALKPILSFGKLRLNYGTTGNDQIGNYSYINSYAQYRVDIPYNNIVALQPQQLFNPYLQWEQTNKLSTGINLGFFNDRVLIDATWYRNRSSNQLMYLPLPSTTGFTNIQTNLPALVQNTGLEINLTTVNTKTKEFEWSSSFNFTRNRNKLLRFDDLEKNGYSNSFFVGHSIGTQKLYHYLGVNSTTGNYQFATAQGEATESPDYEKDQIVLYDPQPGYYGGLTNTVRWKSLVLDFLLNFAQTKGVDYSYGIQQPGAFNSNQPLEVFNGRWQKPGDQASIQRFDAYYTNNYQMQLRSVSDGGVMDIHYLRLRNISLAWQLPQNWIKGTRNLQVYLQGQNVLTFSNTIFDPETGVSLPLLRTITAGVKVGL